MQTLTVTKARANLGHWMKRAARGEDIGVVVGSQIIALRPVKITATDYMETEYGLTPAEADRVVANMVAETALEKKAGGLMPLDEFLKKHAPSASKPKKVVRSRVRKARG